MTVDPLSFLLVGALGASLIGLLGAWVQSRREHLRWVRERRMAACLGSTKVAERMPRIEGREMNDRDEAYLDELRESLGAVRLVGPDDVIEAATEHVLAAVERSEVVTEHGIGSKESKPAVIGIVLKLSGMALAGLAILLAPATG